MQTTSYQNQTRYPSTKVSGPFEQLSDNNASDNGLMIVVVNKKISEVILTLGNDTILMAFQINTHYNTSARDGAFCHINRAWAL